MVPASSGRAAGKARILRDTMQPGQILENQIPLSPTVATLVGKFGGQHGKTQRAGKWQRYRLKANLCYRG